MRMKMLVGAEGSGYALSIKEQEWLCEETAKMLDRETEDWLRKNDPLYHDWRERKKLSNPYYTARQMRAVREKEIPVDPNNISRIKGRRIG